VFTVQYPDAGTQRSNLTIKVPQRLAIQLQGGGSELSIDHVTTVEGNGARGKLDVSDITGLVRRSSRRRDTPRECRRGQAVGVWN